MFRLAIDVWADMTCPWCYLGAQRLSVAIDESGHPRDIEVRVRTFELDPALPTSPVSTLGYAARKHRVSVAEALSMEERMAGMAAAEGLPFELDRPVGNTFDMLRLVHLGTAHGVGWKFFRQLQDEVFRGNFEAFHHRTLTRIGDGLGIPCKEVDDVLATDRYADAVRLDHDAGMEMGVRSVPFVVFGRRVTVPDAASQRQYRDAIDDAWQQATDS